MAIGSRPPPPQFWPKLRRVLGGQTGWGGVLGQLVLVAFVVWLGYEIVANARANMQAQRIASGFGFLSQTAGFGVSQALIPYSESDSYTRVFVVGLLNTLLVSAIGVALATVIGFAIGLGRLSPNWLLARLAGAYVEIVRNLPLLFQLLFWYLAVLATLPNPRQSITLLGWVFLNNRGFVVAEPVAHASFWPVALALGIGVGIAFAAHALARKALFDNGRVLRIWPVVLGSLVGLPLVVALALGAPLSFEAPVLKGFNFVGGLRIIPEFVALTLALSIYTAAFIAEIVRAGILAVNRGQMEAGSSLGLSCGATLRLIVVPQALRVILPPLTNQYLNLTKNSSLAVAVGYPDLFSVFAGTTLSQTGQAVEIIVITMGVYLLISLITSAAMSFYGWRVGMGLGAT
ncbi:MAG: ABC transporter permease subunit [Xanthobacteraceae bacterium]|nr:ABC transporter permease subunit [Xanthobacteraceae bacterium]